ncbi:MAG: hypothetical protein JXA67_10180 [Micromonosporaceae bacterium]|nr:hypothetical protein [Micromonosporaceae bacterium]
MIVAVLLSIATGTSWSGATTRLDEVGLEQSGVAYLGPLTTLVSELTQAQSAAVRGGQTQAVVVTGALNGVDRVDRAHGAALGVRKRWADTRKAINEVIAGRAGTIGVFEQYDEALSLVRQLARRIADTSGLVVDPEVDASYLAEAVLTQLPDIMINAGRAANLAVLDAAGTEGDTMAPIRVAVARYDVAVAAESVGIGLAKALDETSSPTLGPNITGQLDAFRSAVDSFVPSGTRLRGLETTDPATLDRNATLVRQAARPLAEAILSELDGLLSERRSALRWQQIRTGAVTAIALLLAVALLWRTIAGNLRLRSKPFGGHHVFDVGADGVVSASDQTPDTALIDPHDFAAVEELLQSSPASPQRRMERDRDAL